MAPENEQSIIPEKPEKSPKKSNSKKGYWKFVGKHPDKNYPIFEWISGEKPITPNTSNSEPTVPPAPDTISVEEKTKLDEAKNEEQIQHNLSLYPYDRD